MKRRTLAVAVIVTAVTVTATGCSSGSSSTSSPSTPAPSQTATARTLVEVASTTPDLSTLVSAVQAADLVSTLEGAGPFTVFAPTNAAFAALPATVTSRLLLPCNKEALTKILTYHVVPSRVAAADIEPGTVGTVQGQVVRLAVDNGTVTVNDAKVTTADVPASNGVVHVIDGVLLPPGLDVGSLQATC